MRVKHWLNDNSQKLYDKGSVLRSETTINEPKDFRVWRGPEAMAHPCGAAWPTGIAGPKFAGSPVTGIWTRWRP